MSRLSLFVAALTVTIACAACLTVALAPVKHSHLEKPDRKKFCGGDSDCVIVKEHGVGALLKIDDLDLNVDTTIDLLAKLPDWFGPRPARFVHDHNVLVPDRPLSHQGVELMGSIIIYKATGEEDGAGDL